MARRTMRVRMIGTTRGFSYKWCMCGRACGHSPEYKRIAKHIRNKFVRRDAARHIALEME